jgi:hypothetical protein
VLRSGLIRHGRRISRSDEPAQTRALSQLLDEDASTDTGMVHQSYSSWRSMRGSCDEDRRVATAQGTTLVVECQRWAFTPNTGVAEDAVG